MNIIQPLYIEMTDEYCALVYNFIKVLSEDTSMNSLEAIDFVKEIPFGYFNVIYDKYYRDGFKNMDVFIEMIKFGQWKPIDVNDLREALVN